MSRVIAELQNGRRERPVRSTAARFHVIGVEPHSPQSAPSRSAEGRFFNEAEDEPKRGACAVLGDNVRKQLFGERTGAAWAGYIRLNGLPFRIVGLMPDKNAEQQLQRRSTARRSIIPYATMVRDLPPKDANFRPAMSTT